MLLVCYLLRREAAPNATQLGGAGREDENAAQDEERTRREGWRRRVRWREKTRLVA